MSYFKLGERIIPVREAFLEGVLLKETGLYWSAKVIGDEMSIESLNEQPCALIEEIPGISNRTFASVRELLPVTSGWDKPFIAREDGQMEYAFFSLFSSSWIEQGTLSITADDGLKMTLTGMVEVNAGKYGNSVPLSVESSLEYRGIRCGTCSREEAIERLRSFASPAMFECLLIKNQTWFKPIV